jgi:glycosyltransferase involved in cell wall biosynthesis
VQQQPSPDDFADLVHVQLDEAAATMRRCRGDRPALYLLWDGDVPAGSHYLAPGEDPAVILPTVAARVRATVDARPATRPPPARSVTVTVIICTRDRPDPLARCLASLPAQSLVPDEVVVVDNASEGTMTRDVALAAGVRYLREDRPGLDVARNTGLLAATSQVIAYTDDDTELHPRWLERLVGAFDEESVMAVTGLVLPAELATQAQWIFETRWGFGRGFDRVDFGPEFYRRTRRQGCPAWEIGAGANMAFRREVVRAVGLFDERLDVGAAGCSGDSEYWYRIMAAGWTCRYEPTAVVYHYHRRETQALAKQIRAYMRGHVAALLVQYERTGDRGNLRRAFLVLPSYYLLRTLHRLRYGRTEDNSVLAEEIRGALAGLQYYARTRRAAGQRLKTGGPVARS